METIRVKFFGFLTNDETGEIYRYRSEDAAQNEIDFYTSEGWAKASHCRITSYEKTLKIIERYERLKRVAA